MRDQAAMLGTKLLGHYRYFGITGNGRALAQFRCVVERAWRMWLGRRSQRRRMTWERFTKLLKAHPLPKPRVYNSAFKPRQLMLPFEA